MVSVDKKSKAMSEELKACPFCLKENLVEAKADSRCPEHRACQNCGVEADENNLSACCGELLCAACEMLKWGDYDRHEQ